MTPVLSVVVPSYNAAEDLRRCIDSLLVGEHDVDIIIVNDGSKDATAQIADEYAAAHPQVRAVHQDNAGHGGAINTGLRHARGEFIKIVDSDDWVDPSAFASLMSTLTMLRESSVDMVISNFVYEKVGKRRKTVVSYEDVLPRKQIFGWDRVGEFGKRQYLLMHALVYRTQLLRDVNLVLPQHTFYVDNLYAYVPMRAVRHMYYLDVDVYRYFIGRPGQSVAEEVMIKRIDQQLRINREMVNHVARSGEDPEGLVRYMEHYLEIICAVSSTLLARMDTPHALELRQQLWEDIADADRDLYRRLRRGTLGIWANLPGKPGRTVTKAAYWAAQKAVGFN